MTRRPLISPLVLMLALAGASDTLPSVELAPEELVVVVGVPEGLGREIRDTAEAILESAPHPFRFVELEELESGGTPPSGAGRVVALGVDACERLVPTDRPLTCALLSAEAFEGISCAERCDLLEAVVMDQPLSRQVAVAKAVYPALRRFGVLSAREETGTPTLPDGASVAYRRFYEGVPLSGQLDVTLAVSDALVAQPESLIFNRSSLHVVLLTAYGYAKPVIGFGRAYVRAGALISAYSTPEQVLREVLAPPTRGRRDDAPRADGPRVRPPLRFSIADNPRIARSLGLIRRVEIDPARVYSDGDFAS